jgi:membrane-associated protease RseP (regulator of RpoE activity)
MIDGNRADESEPIRAEVVVEMAPGAPWEWQEVRPVQRTRRWKLPLILFVATCASTFLVAAPLNEGWAGVVYGLRYAVPLMIILVFHEMGHFFQAWRYGVYASFPYFIPMPGSPIGTLGAVIVMEPRMGHRRALFDIGITGPLAGLIPTLIFLVVGLHHSFPGLPSRHAMQFGDPLLFRFLANWIVGPIPEWATIVCDPMAFAGWVGLLITSLNLMPIGQLDGGHVLYALLRRKANRVASALLTIAIFLVLLDTLFGRGMLRSWLIMLFLLMMMGPTHPPTADDDEPLGLFRTILGWLTLAFIFIGFTPTPILFAP